MEKKDEMKPIAWFEWKARELNRIFDEASKGKGAASKILPSTVKHGEQQ